MEDKSFFVEKNIYAAKVVGGVVLFLFTIYHTVIIDIYLTKCNHELEVHKKDIKNIDQIKAQRDNFESLYKELKLEVNNLQTENLFRNNSIYPLGLREFQVGKTIPKLEKNELIKDIKYKTGIITIDLKHKLFESLTLFFDKSNNDKVITSMYYYFNDHSNEYTDFVLYQLKKEFPNIKILEHKQDDGSYLIKNIQGVTIEINYRFYVSEYYEYSSTFDDYVKEYKLKLKSI